VDVVWDQRSHPAQSLLHPALRDTQGPCLAVRLKGVVLGTTDVARVCTMLGRGGGGGGGGAAAGADPKAAARAAVQVGR
jgi:hypothetical protein